MKKNKIIILFGLILLSIFLTFTPVKADFDIKDPLGSLKAPEGSISSPEATLETVVNGILTVSQIAFVLMFLIGGVMYLTSMGNDDQMGKARKLLLASIIGIIIVFAAWGVSTWIISTLSG